jgi:hypothetical protein
MTALNGLSASDIKAGKRWDSRHDEAAKQVMADYGLKLPHIARRIDAAHSAVAVALGSAIAHAITAGLLLIEAKRHVRRDKGKWLPWLEANCSVPARTASHYVRLAKHRTKLCDENGNVLPISVTEALLRLKHPIEGAESGRGSGEHEWGEYEPWRGWGRLAWGVPFVTALQAVTRITQANPPAPRHVARAAREGKTPGLSASVLREAIALLMRYADALDRQAGAP